MKILNAFSLNMLGAFPARFEVKEVGLEEARRIAEGAESAVGHAETAAVMGDLLGRTVLTCRATVSLGSGDMALVGQYRGPRLPEGALHLPEGATIQWLLVTVE